MPSRYQAAAYLAEHLSGADRSAAIKQTAAWLVETGRERQAKYLSRDVARALAAEGYVWAEVTSATPLAVSVRAQIEDYLKTTLNAEQVEIEYQIDSAVIGGIRIETAESELDETLRRQLQTLTEGGVR